MDITYTQDTRRQQYTLVRAQLRDWAQAQTTITADALLAAFDEAYTAAAPAREGVTIECTAEEGAALGSELGQLTDWLSTALLGLVALRTGYVAGDPAKGAPTYDRTWYWVINDLAHRLLPRLEGILAAAIREHKATGGSLSHLALAMDVDADTDGRYRMPARSTAQYRRGQVVNNPPSMWEQWARTGGPQKTPHTTSA